MQVNEEHVGGLRGRFLWQSLGSILILAALLYGEGTLVSDGSPWYFQAFGFAISLVYSLVWGYVLINGWRRNIRGYEVYVGFGESLRIQLYQPYEPPPCDHGLIINLASGHARWVVGSKDVRPLMHQRLLLEWNAPVDTAWFTGKRKSLIEPPQLRVSENGTNSLTWRINLFQLNTLIFKHPSVTRIAMEDASDTLPKLWDYEALTAQTVTKVMDAADAFKSSSRLRDTIEGLEMALPVFQLAEILNNRRLPRFYKQLDAMLLSDTIGGMRQRLARLREAEATKRA